ncbi:MAG: hypothetical protein QOI54_3703 [Actinomycetota bacterium]|jgi:hypothetical protein|nr:hypothetical protein [Actinomycetota bacterium]
MAATITAPGRRVAEPFSQRRLSARWVVFVAVVALLATVGGVTAASLLRTSNDPAGQIEGSVSTSFGSLAVHQSEVLNGLSSSALGGMSHGVQNLVADDKVEIAVTVTLVNKRASRLHYAADQFQLLSGRTVPTGAPIAALGTSLSSGVLERGGSVEGAVNFVTAINGKRLWLQYDDNGRQVLVRLGAVARPGAGGEGTSGDSPGGAAHQH